MSVRQMTKMLIWVTVLREVFSVQLINIVTYMLLCGLTSSVRLFYFGTYIPHRPQVVDGRFDETMPWEKANSSNAHRLLSFLRCYHFDYHWEHHRWPYAPWWELWKCKDISRQMNKQ